MKHKIGDKVRIKSLDWYNENKNEDGIVELSTHIFTPGMSQFCGKVMTIEDVFEDTDGNVAYYMEEIDYDWTDEMIECKVEEETPKFKINDIVCVKNIGWVRITNSYWDSLANGYIYEAIGFNGKGEYDNINQSNIEFQMLPESENPHTGGNKITLDEYKNNDKEWLFNKLAMLDNITALESIQDIFNHLQQSKYPKTYKECCDVLSIPSYYKLRYYTYEHGYNEYTTLNKLCSLQDKLNILGKLIICRDAYWKIAGEEMGLGKPWEPDYNNEKQLMYGLYEILKYSHINPSQFVFPTEEMRDAFYENFKDDFNKCMDR